MGKIVAGIDLSTVKAGPLKEVAVCSRKVAADGCVLLKNSEDVLPLKDGERVAVFGRMQTNYIKSGTGSGGLVNAPYVTNIFDELRAEGGVIVNEKLAEIYAEFNRDNALDYGSGWADCPWSQTEMPLSDSIVAKAADESDTALVIIARISGEEHDNQAVKGSYYLSESEEQMLDVVSRYFKHIAVILNSGSVIDMNWVEKYGVSSVMYVWQGGMEGGRAAVDVLRGRVNPSGKLPDTIVRDIEAIPSTPYFGNKVRNCYTEDIYVGYRYFETVGNEEVLYPFGYGLSYTEFKTKTLSVKDCSGMVESVVEVTNIGKYAGREVVQVYYGAPQGKLGKPVKQLAAFKKTRLLNPGESEKLEIKFDIDLMASYDDSGVTGCAYAYVLEAGDYDIYIGTDVKSSEKVFTLPIDEIIITQQLEQALAPTFAFDRFHPTATSDGFKMEFEPVALRKYDVLERIEKSRPADIGYTGDKGYILNDVKNGKCTMEQFIAQLSDDDLIHISRGEGMSSPKVTGTGSAFAGITDRLMNFGIPVICSSDGPSGLRMPGKIEASSLPNGTLMAATWDTELVEELFKYEGIEMYGHKVDTLLGPGINIHRSPLNGRNFEYFSEDPLLTGLMAAAQNRGLLKSNVTATIKHFCANSQETCRTTSDSVVSERALREIYLRPFEIAVKEGEANAIMTSYNKVNGIYTACNYDLNTTILRGDWGYNGFVMTDWWTNTNCEEAPTPEKPTKDSRAPMVRAQNDVYMIVGNGLAGSYEYDDIKEWLVSGKLTRGELARNAMNICRYAMNVAAFDRYAEIGFKPSDTNHKYETLACYNNIEKSTEFNVRSETTGRCIVKISAATPKGSVEQYRIAIRPKVSDALVVIQVGGTDGNFSEFTTEITMCEGNNPISFEFPSDRNHTIRIEKVEFLM